MLSCEHGGNNIPDKYIYLFKNRKDILNSHRGYDIGALGLFKVLDSLPISFSGYSADSRLLVDLNRSIHRRTLFSELTKHLCRSEKDEILADYYYAYRKPFAKKIEELIMKKHKVYHISIHSFTPQLNGLIRNADLGILYHPGRPSEKDFAKKWKRQLYKVLPNYKVRFNYPYLGKPDGHVAYFRKIYADDQYVGIELELNQKHANQIPIYESIKKSLSAIIK